MDRTVGPMHPTPISPWWLRKPAPARARAGGAPRAFVMLSPHPRARCSAHRPVSGTPQKLAQEVEEPPETRDPPHSKGKSAHRPWPPGFSPLSQQLLEGCTDVPAACTWGPWGWAQCAAGSGVKAQSGCSLSRAPRVTVPDTSPATVSSTWRRDSVHELPAVAAQTNRNANTEPWERRNVISWTAEPRVRDHRHT